jgi:hypothetical protein
LNIFSEKACFKKPVLSEKPVKKPAFNLPAGFFNKTWGFSSPVFKRWQTLLKSFDTFYNIK